MWAGVWAEVWEEEHGVAVGCDGMVGWGDMGGPPQNLSHPIWPQGWGVSPNYVKGWCMKALQAGVFASNELDKKRFGGLMH